jgi:precorrin-6Y C5,15-methyltransferase (decarboxylating)
MKVTLIGVGSGTAGTLTAEAVRALTESDVIIGAKRLIRALDDRFTQNRISAAATDEILEQLKNTDHSRAAVVFSGDSGFYSGARLLIPGLREIGIDAEVIPGLSSVQLLSARLMRPWQDWRLVSAHGAECDVISEVMHGDPVFILTGGAVTPNTVCNELIKAGLSYLTVSVGENLGLPDEKITVDTAESAAAMAFSPLNVVLVDAAPVMAKRTPGWRDDMFIRGDVPMTKQTVRAAILSKLGVRDSDVTWDIGAGTGSVSAELATVSRRVYAVELDSEACALIERNRERFHAWNLNLIHGRAPEVLEALPAPDAVFVGGTKGELSAVIDAVLRKNPQARICISAIAIETLNAAVSALSAHGIDAEVTQIAVSNVKNAGGLHMLISNNPIFLITGNCK